MHRFTPNQFDFAGFFFVCVSRHLRMFSVLCTCHFLFGQIIIGTETERCPITSLCMTDRVKYVVKIKIAGAQNKNVHHRGPTVVARNKKMNGHTNAAQNIEREQ